MQALIKSSPDILRQFNAFGGWVAAIDVMFPNAMDSATKEAFLNPAPVYENSEVYEAYKRGNPKFRAISEMDVQSRARLIVMWLALEYEKFQNDTSFSSFARYLPFYGMNMAASKFNVALFLGLIYGAVAKSKQSNFADLRTCVVCNDRASFLEPLTQEVYCSETCYKQHVE